MTPHLEASPPAYVPRDPSQTLLYQVVADHLGTFLALLDADPDAKGFAYVQREFHDYLQCGVLAHGFLRLGCDTCHKELLGSLQLQAAGDFVLLCRAAHGPDRRSPRRAGHSRVPTRQWVVSVPVPLRYWMAASQELTAQVHTIIRTTIGQYYVNQVVTRGVPRDKVQPGSVTFIQRFGSHHVEPHCHCVFLEGVYLDRTEAGLTPRFVTGEPPTDADIAAVITKISHRVIRKLRQLGYLEAGLDAAVATGYDPLRDDAPELARTMAASVQQRLAFGERTGQQVRRISSGFLGAEGEAPRRTGPRCASVQGFSLHANTQVPAHRRDQLERLIRYTARGAVSPERLVQDANGDLVYTFTHPWSDGTTGIRLSPVELLEKLAALYPCRASTWCAMGCLAPCHTVWGDYPHATPTGPGGTGGQDGVARWSWAWLLKRVFALDMARCPRCQWGTLRLIAAITHGEVIRKILQHLEMQTHLPLPQPVSARKPSPGPLPDRASCVTDPSPTAAMGRDPAAVSCLICLRKPFDLPILHAGQDSI